MPDDVIQAVKAAGRDAQKQLDQDVLKLTTSIGLLGTPEPMAGKYKHRALGALAGIYGNTTEEAVYPAYLQRLWAGSGHKQIQLLAYFRTGYTSTRQSILVGHDGWRKDSFPGREPPESLSDQLEYASTV